MIDEEKTLNEKNFYGIRKNGVKKMKITYAPTIQEVFNALIHIKDAKNKRMAIVSPENNFLIPHYKEIGLEVIQLTSGFILLLSDGITEPQSNDD